MKFIQFYQQDNLSKPKVGVKTDFGIIDLTEAAKVLGYTLPPEMKMLIAGDYLDKIQEIIQYYTTHVQEVAFIDEDDVTIAPVVSNPEKIICVGLNYQDHVSESGISESPADPVLFSKFNNALAGHQQVIPLNAYGHEFDYEGELVVVVGKAGQDIAKADALDHVFGYSIANDVSVRDLQFKSGQWLIGKTNDGSAPVGPYITTKNEVDVQNLAITSYRNGTVVQSANTQQMIFSVVEIIAYISQYMTLQPGDLILTGTPSGVVMGYEANQQNWLTTGDEVTIEIEGLGKLSNKFEKIEH